jgi:dynein heavy chain, axonemal
MGKFFKGLAAAGAWACFDEFNRIDVEVLSVVAQQVLTLTEGVRAGVPRIFFEGTEIPLNPRFASFITMNPGYAGRSELPDNLKVLYRPVAMMVPDYALIGEIMLYSFGFEKARGCADKMVTSFRLCSEQLSSQDHYDYGMRAVKSVITAAGNLKGQYPDEDEELLLYRALSDVNLPKFLAPDLPLFRGIMSDIFPSIKNASVDHGDLNRALVVCTEKRGLQPVPFFITKCVQLYEMVVVRHGMMMVGPTGGGKTCMLKVTQSALTMMTNKGCLGPKVNRTHVFALNPKSITMGQLYGQFDDNTHEWTDGILADLVRECAKAVPDPAAGGGRFAGLAEPDLRWVLFDGPVDAIWIENMNTVLDDNKKLCLVSGEIIGLSNAMTIIFEVEDLSVASPATVSRCGMVYTEPTSLGYDVMVQSWIEALPPCFSFPMKASLQAMFDSYVKSTMYFLRRYLDEPVPTTDNQLVRGLTNLLDCAFEPFAVVEGRDPPSADAVKALSQQLPAYFVFALIWSVAATSNTEGRKRFNAFLRAELESGGFAFPFPDTGLIYDFLWDQATAKWVTWMSTIPAYEVPRGADFSEIIVQTKDTVRYKYLARQLLTNRKLVLMSGPTGTGKTVNIVELLSADMPKEFIPITLTFSAQTSANQTQDIIDGKMEKRQRGTFGPPAGNVFVIFVDDLNMPQKEVYGAQPPIEILRQWVDYGGWYDRKERVFKKIVDTVLVAAMGPPGGGRNPITQRMVRHFNVINYTPMDDESMRIIFETILTNFCLPFPDAIKALVPAVTTSTIAVYNTIADQLLPTPAKPHYTFNLRDLGKVFQGMLMADSRRIAAPPDFARMWVHETRRVFMDRLINSEDRSWFNARLRENIEGTMKLSWDDVVGERSTILYGDYMVPGADPKIYAEVDNMANLQPVIEEYLNDYNAESKTPMKLVMFLDAIEHVSRISRIIRQPGGNALLLGVGGSGRQSLTRLATFMADYTLFTIEIAKGYGKVEWRDDLKKVLLKAGVEEKPTVFLFNDTQIIFEGMVEDLNNILNSGDVPNLYAPEDLDAIMNACRNDCLKKRVPPTKINIFAQYLARVKRNIHMVLAMSPMGEPFRNRLRMFPALVNCTTIDWFSEWPDEALKSVALKSLLEKDLALGETLDGVVEFFKVAHQGVAESSRHYASQMRRHNYVTPTSYLELLGTFKGVLQRKREEVGTLKNRLQIGLDKIISTEGIVSKLQEEIVAMQPVLKDTQEKVAAMIIQIDKDKLGAAETKKIVEEEETAANKKAAETKAIADDAQADLDKALPALEKAVESLDKLKKSDLDEVKALKTPPRLVKTTMQAALIMFNIKPKVVNDPDNPGKKMKDWWSSAQSTILQDAKKLLSDLKEYDKDNIPDSVIQEIDPLVKDPDFTFEQVDKASKACSGICLWVHAMYTYFFVAKNVEPKKAKLREAQESLDATMASLALVKARLKGVEDKIAELEAGFNAANGEKERLAKEVALATARLDRAHKLLGGLGGEKGRWIITVAKLTDDYTALVGDSLVAATTIAYLGAFTSDYRASLVKTMQGELARLKLPHSAGCNMINVLADPVQVRAWNLAGLPTDQHSVENGIIMRWARRWPLLIDPQGQANRYIKNMGKDKTMAPNGIDVLRMTEKKFLQGLENGIRFGKWVLIEAVGESLDAALEPVLLQQIFKQGGSDMIKLGDSTVPYNSDFRLFMTSTLPNPHYAPESQVKVSLLNFTITPKGLEDQLLGVFVITELPELEEKKNALMLSNARNKKELQDIESRILFLLSNSKGNILDDSELIETLAVSKVKAADITAQVKEAEITEKEIDATRENYRPVAFRASILYFCIADLSSVDPMYQYSLPWFTNLFVNGIRNSPPAEDADTRMANLNSFFTYSIYKNVCRSLFEVHKPLFSLLLTIKILQGDNRVEGTEWRFVISGLTPHMNASPLPNPAPDWVTDKIWAEASALATLDAFKGFDASWSDPEHLAGYRAIFDSNDSHKVPLPGKFAGHQGLQKLCVLRCIRPDKLLLAAQDYVIDNMGKKFVEPPPFDLASCYEDSSVAIPLIFVLSTGSDPTRAFFSFAETLGMRSKVEGISLGQGQGVIAARLIEEAQTKGSWVLLQNCHLAASWMPELERIVEAIDPEKVSRDFRLWLTSMPTKAFPVSILQNGIKMTNEPPKGLKANIRNFFYSQNDETLSQTTKPTAFRKLLFGLAFFHAVIQERKRFGPLGWNRPYDFNESDMEISMRQVMLYLDEYEAIPYRVMHVLTSYINYGGRVTDDKDSRTIDVILRDYFTARVLDDDYKFTPSGTYYSPTVDEDSPHKGVMEYIEGLPLNAQPEVFGMHSNANITCELNETDEALDVLVSLQPRTSGGGGLSREDIIADRAKDIQKKMPALYDIEAIQMKYPVLYNESMNTVLAQECIRYNKLLAAIKKAVADVQKALKGLIVMSKELDAVGSALATNRVPGSWESKAYPSLKPLGAWILDLVDRLNFIGGWVEHGPPAVFWISGFFFPQAFLTGTMQNYARRLGMPIDTLGWDYVYQNNRPWETIKAKPEVGCYIRGLFLEGARFDEDKGLLADSLPKVLFTSLPVIHLVPVQFRKAPTKGIYRCVLFGFFLSAADSRVVRSAMWVLHICLTSLSFPPSIPPISPPPRSAPIYKILSRWGVLATTGHSSNFVQFLEIPTDRGDITNNEGHADCGYWIKAGVASFTQLKF